MTSLVYKTVSLEIRSKYRSPHLPSQTLLQYRVERIRISHNVQSSKWLSFVGCSELILDLIDNHSRIFGCYCFMTFALLTSSHTKSNGHMQIDTIDGNCGSFFLIGNVKPLFPLRKIKIASINHGAFSFFQSNASLGFTLFPISQLVLVYPGELRWVSGEWGCWLKVESQAGEN